jgi:hypothetical protein
VWPESRGRNGFGYDPVFVSPRVIEESGNERAPHHQVTGRTKLAIHRPHQRQPTIATHKKPVSSDQAPGEETVQVNDQYVGGGPPPSHSSSEHDQHQTGG